VIASTRIERVGVSIGGKYKIVRLMAEGGMGAVYEAVHVVVKRRFAVKFLRADLTQRRDALLRFQREAAAAGALESENIAAVVDFGITDDGAPYIVMEYLVGRDLAGLLRGTGPLPVERATDIVLQACLGIKEAHAAGVIHRDLKPENLFVCRRSDGSDLVKIVDFGIAKLQASDAGAAVTKTGGVVGTPSYMSPEQARGGTAIDPRTDVYALGVILYELLSGHTPHPGDSYNAVIYHIATQPALALTCDSRELPQDLIEIVQRAIARDPADRPPTVEEFSQQLAPFAQRQVWPVSPCDSDRPSPADAVRAIEQSFDESPLDKSDSPREPGRARSVWLLAGSVAMMALLAGGYFAMSSRKQPVRSETVTPRTEPASAGVPSALAHHPSSESVAINLPASAPASQGTILQPASIQPAAERSNSLRPMVVGSDAKRTVVTPGRPQGRPTPNVVAAQPLATTNAAPPSGVHATFDPRNPYE
jgi:serine/threonine protein kinase